MVETAMLQQKVDIKRDDFHTQKITFHRSVTW
jgi:hypothetical protein